jgi:uncharacterized protein
MTGDATIDYEALQQEALRGLVRNILVRVGKSGLPGDHHLYISFDVRAPGVILSKRLREKYPSEMTIVLQHRFWDLVVSDERFEVKLTFDGIPERLVVPFAAIKVFLDPSVRYVLHFEEPTPVLDGSSIPPDATGDDNRPAGPRSITSKKSRVTKVKSREISKDGDTQTGSRVPTLLTKPTEVPAVKPKSAETTAAPLEISVPAGEDARRTTPDRPAPSGSAQVVSLDAFRKK